MTRTVLLVIAHTVVAFAASAQAQTSSSSSSSGSSSSIRSSSATSTVASSTLTAPLSASSVSSISNYPFSTVNVATSVAAQNVTTATRATITGPPLTVFSTAATTIAFTAATTRTTSAAVATSTVLATATASASALPSASNAATTASASTTRSSSISTSAALTVAPSPSPTAVPSNCTIPGQFYQCGTCTFVTLADCRGTCPSSSTTSSSWYVRDCSGACVPQSVAAVIDQCGICGGTGSSCLDCNGVANGTSVRDGCGVCGGAGECNFSFKAMAPLVVPNTGAAMVDVFGTGFDILTAAVYTSAESTLQVLVNGALVPFSRIVSSTTSGIRFIMPAVSIPASATSTAAVVSLYLPLSRTTINDTLTVYASQVANSTTSTRLYRNRDSDLYMQISRLLAWPLPVTVAPIRPPVCQFGTISGILTSSVSLFGNSTLVCRVPSFPTSQPVTWGMILEQPVQDGYSNKTSLLYRQDLFVPYASSVSAVGQIDVYAPAPSVSYARFDNTGDSILVAFAVPIAARVQGSALATGTSVSVGLSSFATVNLWIPQPCSVVFVTNSATSGAANLTRAGVASDCSLILTDASTLKISVSSAATLSTVGDAYSLPITLPRIGSTLAVLPNTLYAASEAYADPFQGSIVIGPPLSPLRPTLVVRAPPSIGNCDNLVFDLSQVSNAGGRPFAAISVAFTSTVTTLRDPILTANLQTLAQTLLTGQYLLTVPASWLTARTYTFTFTLSNFLGGSATKTVQVIKTSTSDTPLLSLSGPSGPSSAGRAIDLSAQVVLPASCNASLQTGSSRTNSSWFYAWRYVSGGPLGFNGTASLSSILSSARLVLSIPPFSLSPGISNYTFAFSASNPSPGGGLGPVMTSGTIVIATAADVLWVSAGPNFAASADRSLVLSASFGSDSYAVPLSASVPLSFQWACLQAVSLDPCVDRRTNRTLVLASTAAVNVTGQLSPGVYAFTATVINTATGSYAVSNPTTVTVQAAVVPRVFMHASTLSPSAYQPEFYIQASYDPATVTPSLTPLANILFYFSSIALCGSSGIAYSTIDLASPANVLTSYESSTLKFAPGVLVPGARYCIQSTVVDNGARAIGSAQLAFTVRQGPRAGQCALTSGSSSGTELSTLFAVSCQGWITESDAYPILYEFQIQSADGSWSALAPASTSPLLQTVFLAGTYAMRVVLSDAKLSRQTWTQVPSISVSAAAAPSKRSVQRLAQRLWKRQSASAISTAQAYFDTVVTGYLVTDGDARRALTSSALLLDILYAVLPAQSAALRSSLLGLVTTVLQSGSIPLDTVSWGPFVANYLFRLIHAAPGGFASPADQTRVVNALDAFVSRSTFGSGCLIPRSTAASLYAVLSHGALASSRAAGTVNASPLLTPSFVAALLGRIDSCLFATMVCGESPLLVRSTDLNRTIGTTEADAEPPSVYCAADDYGGFNVPWPLDSTGGRYSTYTTTSGSVASASGCFQYTCGSMTSVQTSALVPSSGDIGTTDTLQVSGTAFFELVFRDASTGGVLAVNTSLVNRGPIPALNDITFTMPFDPSFKAAVVSRSLDPRCAYIDPATAKLSSLGCSFVSSTSTSISCRCTSLKSFVPAGVPVNATPSDIPDPTVNVQPAGQAFTQTVGFIALIAVVCVVAVLGAGTLAVLRIRRKKRVDYITNLRKMDEIIQRTDLEVAGPGRASRAVQNPETSEDTYDQDGRDMYGDEAGDEIPPLAAVEQDEVVRMSRSGRLVPASGAGRDAVRRCLEDLVVAFDNPSNIAGVGRASIAGDPGLRLSKQQVLSHLSYAISRVERGEDTLEIDRNMALLGNLGPLQMADCIGLDVCYLNMLSMLEATNDPKYTPPRTLAQFVQEGQLGVKSKLGFYDYTSMDIDVHNGFTTQQIVDNLMLAYDGAVPQTDMGPGSPAIVYFSDSPDQQQQQQQQQQQDQPARDSINSQQPQQPRQSIAQPRQSVRRLPATPIGSSPVRSSVAQNAQQQRQPVHHPGVSVGSVMASAAAASLPTGTVTITQADIDEMALLLDRQAAALDRERQWRM